MKTIVILSTEPWDKILLSKMHFAIELASMGNKVYFVNPPIKSKSKKLAEINDEKVHENICLINTKSLKGSLFFRHKFFFIYQKISEGYVKAIKKIVANRITELWCFNPHVYTDLRSFCAGKTLLLLYDSYQGSHINKVANTADTIISVSQVILDSYKACSPPKILLQHGLGKSFEEAAKLKLKENIFLIKKGNNIKIGYVGNLFFRRLDFCSIRKIINEHLDKEFHFWGPYSFENNNVVSENEIPLPETISFIEYLKQQPHVFLHGVKNQRELVKEMDNMDAFILFYATINDIRFASNSHKIIEYLSTGKVIISNPVYNYLGTHLFCMVNNHNKNLPALFSRVINNLNFYNGEGKQQQRIQFALENTYSKQVERIHQFIYS